MAGEEAQYEEDDELLPALPGTLFIHPILSLNLRGFYCRGQGSCFC